MSPSLVQQRGVMILEALIAIFIFSIGALGLVAMYASSMVQASDAQYRMEATNFANQLMNEIWINGNRTDPLSPGRATAASLTPFRLNDDSADFDPTNGICEFGGGSTNTMIDDWVDRVTADGSGLPGTNAEQIQVLVDPTAMNQVTITICWRTPQEAAANNGVGLYRYHVLVGNVM